MKPVKKCIAFVLCAALALTLVPAAHAAGNVRVALPQFAVTLGGQTIDPAKEEYPFLVYRDITYLPLTYFGCRLLGLYEKWTEEGGLVISDAGARGQYESTPRRSSNSGALYAQKATGTITLCGISIDNGCEEYPFLLFRDVTYLPMTWVNMHDRLGCEYTFDRAKGLVIDRAQTTNGAALYLPIYRSDEFDVTGAIAAWEGWFWYHDSEGWISRTPMTGGEREKLFELPINQEMPAQTPMHVLPGLSVREDGLFMTYHTGGATMGRDWQYLFHTDGTCELLTDFCGAFGKFDGFSLLANCNLSPTPNNLMRSSDGETWERFGDEHTIYGWSYCESRENGTASGKRGTGDLIYQSGNYAYLLGTDVSDWDTANGENTEHFSAVCRVDLTSGKTEPVTGPAARFRLVNGKIWYLDFDGALHRCALDGSGDTAAVTPLGGEKVTSFCADERYAYAIVTDGQSVGGMGGEAYAATKSCLAVVSPDGEATRLDLGIGCVYAMQLEGGWLTLLLENGAGDETGLIVCRNGKKVYENYGPDYLAAGVSNGKLYYVLK